MIDFCFISFFFAQISICKCSNLLNFRPTRPFRACCFKDILTFRSYLNHLQNFSNLKKDRERFGFLR